MTGCSRSHDSSETVPLARWKRRPVAGFETQPTCRQDAQAVAVADESDLAAPVAAGCEGPGYDPIDPNAYLVDGLALGDGASEDGPVRVMFPHFGRGAAFQGAVLPFPQVGLEDDVAESGQLGRTCGPNERARQDDRELPPGQPGGEGPGLVLPVRGERDVGHTGVLTRLAPLRGPVTHQHQRGPHDRPSKGRVPNSAATEAASQP